MPVQISADEIPDEDARLVKGWASVEVIDRAGEIIPITELKKAMKQIMRRGGKIMDTHTSKSVGDIIWWNIEKHPTSGKMGVAMEYEIGKTGDLENLVWKEIKDGTRKGLSFGGTTQSDEFGKTIAGTPFRKLLEVDGFEVSSVNEPENQLSTNTEANLIAKSGLHDFIVEKLPGCRNISCSSARSSIAKKIRR